MRQFVLATVAVGHAALKGCDEGDERSGGRHL